MIYKTFGDTVAIRLEKGEEVLESIKEVCEKENITAGTIQALGACDHAVVGVYNVEEKKSYANTFDEALEITNLTGNISVKNGEVYLHIHATLGNEEGKCFGGHLNEAKISATCEIFIHKINGYIGRIYDENIGLNLIDFNKERFI